MDSNKKRLDRLEMMLKRRQDPIYTVTLRDGSEVTCTYEQAWDYLKNRGKSLLVEAVTVDRDDHTENAKLLEVLCKS